MKNFDKILKEMKACIPAKKWAEGKDFETVWVTCHRGEWMGWLVDELGIDKRLRVLVAGHCADTVRHLMTDERSADAVDVCIRYGNGEATEEELAAAREAAITAASDAVLAAVGVASDVVWVAVNATVSAASETVRDAESAAAWGARGATRATASAKTQQQTANIIRQYITSEMMIEKLETL